ncbi:MAG TPA: DUF6776 family protein [Alcanivorax sp.]|nr:DUF6776 family protein [Alcanivorax sp.]
MAGGSRPRAGVDDVILVPVSPSHRRRARVLLTVTALVAVVVAFLAGSWLGQSGALDSNLKNSELRAELRAARQEQRTVRQDLARYRAEVEVADQAREQLRQEIRALRDQSAELEEAVAFYKNVMSPGASDAPMQVQKFEVIPDNGERRFRYRLILVQSGDNRGYVSGTVSFVLKGSRDGKPVTLDAGDLLGENSDLRFRFRYFQELSGTLTVPEDMRIDALEMTARATSPRRAEVVQSLPW